MKAQKCPVCNGIGKVPLPWTGTTTTATQPTMRICHGCHGKGWVAVSDMVDEQMNVEEERLADIDVAMGRVKTFDNVNDLMADLRN